MEQNVAIGIKRTKITVIFRNSELQASNISFNSWEYSPILPTAMPIKIAMKISCIIFDSRNGLTKLPGTMPTMVSLMEILTSEETTVEASAASLEASSGLPG